MKFQLLGNTGLSVSAVSFGGAAVGQQYGPVSVAEVADTITAAHDAGINLIDTSAYYGEGKSEEILGDVLQGELKNQFLICTKAGRFTSDRFDFSATGMRESLEGSLRRLKRNDVDILLAHDIEYANDYEKVFEETAQALHDFKREGKCRFVGMSCYPLGLLKQAIQRCQLDVVISYCHFNLQNQKLLSELLPFATQHGVGILNASPLGMGLLTPQGPPAWHPAGQEIQQACANAAGYCQSLGASISELGMQFCYAENRIPSTITGTAKRDELLANLAVVDMPIDQKLLQHVMTILEPVRDRTWASGKWPESGLVTS